MPIHLTRRSVFGVLLLVASFVIASALPAAAQLSRVSPSSGASTDIDVFSLGGPGTDIAYDPGNDLYLAVGGYSVLRVMYVNASGARVSSVLQLPKVGSWGAASPRLTYSSGLNNGQGGFVLTWHADTGPSTTPSQVWASVITLVNGAPSATQAVAVSGAGTNQNMGAPAAYSPTSGKFLVAWSLQGSLGFALQVRAVSSTGAALGGITTVQNNATFPSLTWNPATDEFGLGYTGWGGSGAFAALRRIRASDLNVSTANSFGFTAGTYNSAISVNTLNNKYVMTWYASGGMQSAAFDQTGTLLGNGLASSGMYGTDNVGLAFNPSSKTFLLVAHGNTAEVAGMELNGNGAPNSGTVALTGGGTSSGGSFYPRAAGRNSASHWALSYSKNKASIATQIVGTSTSNGGTTTLPGGGGTSGGGGGGTTTPPPPTGCTTPDPFASMGGGQCVNGGWLPKTSTGGTTTPPPPTGCTTPDPFTSMGGGTCVNGGWVAPTSGGCTTPDPFVSMGGGVCVNGGWKPKTTTGGGTTTTPPPPPPPTGCTTPDPFLSMGGGQCVNGGWLPKTSTSTGGGTTPPPPPPPPTGCTTPDPFVSMGGGVCINGGWMPK